METQLQPVVTGEFPIAEVAVGLFPGLGWSMHDTSGELTGTAIELAESSGDGMDTAQLALGVATDTFQDGPGTSIAGHPLSLGAGDIGHTAEQNAAGLGRSDGKSLPSLVSVSDIGAVSPSRQGVLQGDPEATGSMSANPVTSASSESLQSTVQGLTGAALGALSQTDNADAQALNVRSTPDSVGVTTGVVSDGGKPLIASAPDAARQSSWLIEQPVNSRNWEDGFGDRILWLMNNKQPVAELRLNPPHLGAMEVRIAVQGDQAQIAFQVPGGAARDAVEAALPRLREMFAEAGMNLSDVGVSDHPSHQDASGDADGDTDQSGSETPASESIAESGSVEVTAINNTGQLDLFV